MKIFDMYLTTFGFIAYWYQEKDGEPEKYTTISDYYHVESNKDKEKKGK